MSGQLPKSGNVELHVMWRETDTRVDVLRARVREGVDVMAASEFARWLRGSGVLGMLQRAESKGPLPVRGLELAAKVERLVSECGDWFAHHERSNTKPHPQIPQSELEAIHEQLRTINAHLGDLLPQVSAEPPTILQVGGASTPAQRAASP